MDQSAILNKSQSIEEAAIHFRESSTSSPQETTVSITNAPAQNSNALPNVVVILNVLIAVLIVTLIALFILYRRLLNLNSILQRNQSTTRPTVDIEMTSLIRPGTTPSGASSSIFNILQPRLYSSSQSFEDNESLPLDVDVNKEKYLKIMKEIENKLSVGEGNQNLGRQEMKKLLQTFKLDYVADNCREDYRKNLIHQGFQELIELGENQFNPNTLPKALIKLQLYGLATKVVIELCEKNDYPVINPAYYSETSPENKVESLQHKHQPLTLEPGPSKITEEGILKISYRDKMNQLLNEISYCISNNYLSIDDLKKMFCVLTEENYDPDTFLTNLTSVSCPTASQVTFAVYDRMNKLLGENLTPQLLHNYFQTMKYEKLANKIKEIFPEKFEKSKSV